MAVVVSDMRMPGMDGAAFLAEVRSRWPEVVRMLLTGQSDIESAIAAINKGQIFRFLTKPCPPPALLAAVQAAVAQHELITAERVLLEQTLHGSIKALTDMLALVSPVSFGRATRVKQLVSDIAGHLGLKERWQVEVAAMLSQIGHMTLPAETAERVYYGRALSNDEQRLVARLPGLTESLLGNIPRLETVREIQRTYPLATAGALPEDPVKPSPSAVHRSFASRSTSMHWSRRTALRPDSRWPPCVAARVDMPATRSPRWWLCGARGRPRCARSRRPTCARG
jgi:FixJ family two-component response regulator